MNTLSDTDEGRARPSVWPVCVMGAMLGLFSLSFLSMVWFLPMMAQLPAEAIQQLSPGAQNFHRLLQQLVPYAELFSLYGLFGIATAVGAVLLRPWAWWCAVVWVGVYFLWPVSVIVAGGISEASLTPILLNVAFYGLSIWSLATRRQLFFPRA